jgi:hypothetical protein
MPRGRPKKLSNYEQLKAKKIRNTLNENNIGRFDIMNDSSLLNTVHIDSGGKVYVSYDYHDECLRGLCKVVNDFANR